MAENLQQKQHAKTQVDRQLARLEEQVRNFRRISLAPPPPCRWAVAKGSLRGVHPRPQIYTLEAEYLDETANTGNVVVVRAPAPPCSASFVVPIASKLSPSPARSHHETIAFAHDRASRTT
jgi:hypothetical protein